MESFVLHKSFGFIILVLKRPPVGVGGGAECRKGPDTQTVVLPAEVFVRGGEKVIVSRGRTRPRWLQDSCEMQFKPVRGLVPIAGGPADFWGSLAHGRHRRRVRVRRQPDFAAGTVAQARLFSGGNRPFGPAGCKRRIDKKLRRVSAENKSARCVSIVSCNVMAGFPFARCGPPALKDLSISVAAGSRSRRVAVQDDPCLAA